MVGFGWEHKEKLKKILETHFKPRAGCGEEERKEEEAKLLAGFLEDCGGRRLDQGWQQVWESIHQSGQLLVRKKGGKAKPSS